MSALTYTVFFTIRDAKGDASTVSFDVDNATPLANMNNLVAALGELIDPLINGAIVAAGFTITVDTIALGFQGIPAAIADVQEGARFAFRTTNQFLRSFRLPTFIEDLFTPGSKQVDTADPDVAAFIAAVETGVDLSLVGGTGVIPLTDSRGEDIEILESARENFTRSRN